MKDQDDRLEAWLARTPQIDDDGFTEALMARLPARRPPLWMRAAIPIAASIVSCGVAAAVPGARELAVEVGFALAGATAPGADLLAIAGATAPGANLLPIAAAMALLVGGAVAAGASET